MGLFDKFKKDEKKKNREVGSNFDKTKADEIFDVLDKHDSNEKSNMSKKMKKEIGLEKEISTYLKDAKKLEKTDENKAIELYEKILIINPDTAEAYEGLANIYQSKNDKDNEIKILKKGIKNIETNNKIKNNLIQRLKKIN